MIGQDALIQDIYNSIKLDIFSHATLLVGSAGYGVLPLALDIATFLVCSNQQEIGPCQSCNACNKSAKFIHPDIHFAFPVVGISGKLRKSVTSVNYLSEWREQLMESPYLSIDTWVSKIASTSAKPDINVAECTQIMQQLNLQAFEGGAKVQLIWMSEFLGGNGNKLLKLIEEPPENTYILLLAESDEFILNTIKSRCRIIKLPRIDEEAISSALVEKYDVSKEQAAQISFIAEGDWITAKEYVEYDNSELMNYAIELLGAARSKDVLLIRDWVDKFTVLDAMSGRAVIVLALKILKEILHIKVMGSSMMRLSSDALQAIQRYDLIEHLDIDRIQQISEILSETDFLLGRNINSKILMYNSCLQIESVFNPSVMYINK